MAEKYSWSSLEQTCKQIVSEQLRVDVDKLTLDTHFVNDLSADSLDEVELLMEMEEEFDVNISDEAAEGIHSIADGIKKLLDQMPREMLALVDTQVIAFQLGLNGIIHVALRAQDGSWTYADGSSLLPSKLFLVTLSRWEPVLRELEQLINDPKTKEADLQDFFEQYPELMAGDDYDVVIPQATILRDSDLDDWKADFVLAPVNQVEFAKIVDLKLPSMALTKRPQSGHIRFTAKLWGGICQLRDYGRSFDRDTVRNTFRDKYRADVFRPDLHLIAGRRWDFEWRDNIKALPARHQGTYLRLGFSA